MRKVGVATTPLDYGKCPRWLFERMKRLGRSIALCIIEEFGEREFLRRISDPVWFQSLGCVMGFDWNSSGLTVTTLGALKAGLFDIQDKIGVYICGGKKVSRETPKEIETYGVSRGFSFFKKLIKASKMTAKVDSCLIQDGYQLYHHNFLFTKSGEWAVIQQGMDVETQTARRYHWLGDEKKEFIEEPHSGIISQIKKTPLNLTSKKSRENRQISLLQATQEPKTFLKHIQLISQKETSLVKQKRLPGFVEMELEDKEFHFHPVQREKFDLKRLRKIIEKIHFLQPKNFEELLAIEGVGQKTLRALSLVAEVIYGASPSFEDPARYSFAHGGKDGTPYPVDRLTYDKTIEILEKGIKKAKISLKEKESAQKRLMRILENGL